MSTAILTIVTFILGIGVGLFLLKKETGITKNQRMTAAIIFGIIIVIASLVLNMIDRMFQLNSMLELVSTIVVLIAMVLTQRASVSAFLTKAKA